MERARQEEEKALGKVVNKYKGIFLSAPLKEVFKLVKYSREQVEKKRRKRAQQLEQYLAYY